MILDYSLSAFKVPGLASYTPPFGSKKPDGTGLTTAEINTNVMMPFMRQRSIAGVPVMAGNDPPLGVISEDAVAQPIEFDATFAVGEGVRLQLADPSYEGQLATVVASFNAGSPATIILGIAGMPEEMSLTAGDTYLLLAVNGKWSVFSGGNTDAHSLPQPFVFASDRRRLTIKAGTRINLETSAFTRTLVAKVDMEIDAQSILDTGTLANGRDYYLFLCPDPAGAGVLLRASLTKTNPQGFAAGDVLLIGGFHTLCANVGTGLTYVEGGVTKDHLLNGFVAGDILPQSVWCLNHRPFSEPEGMVYVPSLDFWCDIYLQSGSGENTQSIFQGALTRSRQYVDHVEDMFCIKKELLDDAEFAAAMLGSNEMTAVNGASEAGATTGGAGGRVDTASRRMVSIYGIEEGCGSLWQWLRTTSAGGRQGTIWGQTSAAGVIPVTYGDIVMTSGAHGPFGQSGEKGSFWGLAGALAAGGHWVSAAVCGSRSRSASNARSFASTGHGGRGRSRPMRFAE